MMIIGLVGIPSSGKSTFFKASTLANVEISPRPFTTIKATEGTAYVSLECVDKEFKVQCNPRYGYCLNHERFVPIKLVDVPGLIQNAHKGAGLGLAFLSSLNEADALIHVVDVSGTTNEQGQASSGHDVMKNINILENELDQWYFSLLKKGWEKFSRTIHQEHQNIIKALSKQLSGLKVTERHVEDTVKKLSLSENPVSWSQGELFALTKELRKLSKPVIIAANKIDMPNAFENFKKLKETFKDSLIIPCSAESELALREASKNKLVSYVPGHDSFERISDNLTQQQLNGLEFINTSILKKYHSTGIQECLNKAVFDFLKYIAIFQGGLNNLKDKKGNVLPDCFLLPENSTALDFAFKIHQDIGNNFIKAVDVKTRKVVGKEHLLKNRDVIEITSL